MLHFFLGGTILGVQAGPPSVKAPSPRGRPALSKSTDTVPCAPWEVEVRDSVKPISDFISSDAVCTDLKSTDREGAIGELAHLLHEAYPELKAKTVYNLLLARERLCSTAMESGMAIPHAKVSDLSQLKGAIALSKEGVDFCAPTGEKTHIFFVLISPENAAGQHLMALAQISRAFHSPQSREKIMKSTSPKELYAVITGS